MVNLRHDKVMSVRESIPTPPLNGPESGDVLVVAWGSTFGQNRAAVERLQKEGRKVTHMHMRHLWPFPKGLAEIFGNFKRIIVPELKPEP